MNLHQWIICDVDKEKAMDIANECDISAFVALLLQNRGITQPYDIDEFLSEETVFTNPLEYIDIEKSVVRINKAIAEFEKIVVYGDYDADGVCSTAVLYKYLCEKGANVTYYIPERKDGYGLNINAINKFKDEKINLIITVDNGITAHTEVDLCNSYNIDVIITDHHLPADTLPQAFSIVNPHRSDCPSSYKYLSGAGVAFKLICALEEQTDDEFTNKYIDLVCISTIADIMPLNGDNRCIVKKGLESIKTGSQPWLNSMFNAIAYDKQKITSTGVAFTLAPRINAAGRMGKVQKALKLLIENDEKICEELAVSLNTDNDNRRILESEITKCAIQSIEQDKLLKNSRVLIVCGSDWNHGIIGIVASKICEYYGKPCIILSKKDGVCVGSARSVSGFSIFLAIKSCEDLLIRFGGHDLAAGLTINEEQLDGFIAGVNSYAKQNNYIMPFKKIDIDCKLRVENIILDTVEAISELEPFGNGNSIPTFALMEMQILKITFVGNNKHLKLTLIKNNTSIEAIMFNVTAKDFCYIQNDIIDIAVQLNINDYNGTTSVGYVIKDYRISNIGYEDYYKEIRIYENYLRGELFDIDEFKIKINKDSITQVYKYIKNNLGKNNEHTLSYQKIILTLNLNYFVLNIILDILEQLSLIQKKSFQDKCVVKFNKNPVKVELEQSEIYKKFI